MTPGKEANRRAAGDLEILARVVKRKSRRMAAVSDLSKQIQIATKRTRALRKTAPYLFPEWQRVQQLKRELQTIKAKYKKAKREWKESCTALREQS